MAAFEMAEAEVTEVLQSEGSARQVPPEYGVSAKRLLVRGKGELEKPTRSSLSIVNPSVLTPESVIGTDDRIRIRVLDPETMPWRTICF